MLRYALLAGAAALVMIPGVGSAQSSMQSSPSAPPSDTGAPPPAGVDQSQGWQDQSQPNPPPSNAPGVTDQGATDMNRSGSAYTSQPGQPGVASAPQANPSGAQTAAVTPGYGATSTDLLNSDQQVVVAAAHPRSARAYVQRAAMNDTFQFLAAQIALQRSNTQAVKDYANGVVDQHTQSLAILTPAANQAGIVPVLAISPSQRAQLDRLRRASDADFDRIYMNQQVTVHMNALAWHQGYAANGDNSGLQQAAQQIVPIVQQRTNLAWNESGSADRLAALRNNENDQLAQGPTRSTTTYRGYTVIGPTSPSQVRYQGGGYEGAGIGQPANPSGTSSGQPGTPQYQGYTSQPAPGVTPQPGASQPAPGQLGSPQYPGYTSPPAPGVSGQPGTPQYQGYTNQPSPGSTAPGTTPQYQGYPPGTLNSPSPGTGNMNTTTPSTPYPGATNPGSPGYTTPGTTPQTPPAPETNPH